MTNPTIPKAEIISPLVTRPKWKGGKCPTCNSKHPFDNVFCSNGYHLGDTPTTTPAEAGDGKLERLRELVKLYEECEDAAAERIKHLETALLQHDKHMIEDLGYSGPDDPDLDPHCAEDWARLRAALAARIEPLDGDRA